eukprot:gnl/TRDRNA2_/TRDRNA2_92547_c1_seq1.p1 gnl/TRDRNA2_/TRDRNA2_92547_c1~~gnl/TRDRNA2_/TRDRNA2_92547_c1_seq1.p1  ORF type:complete len:388 (+),score=51.80 gnl/TRDRNA2_/TRDRNA2_92547_c1_seq1:125-1288(+)
MTSGPSVIGLFAIVAQVHGYGRLDSALLQKASNVRMPLPSTTLAGSWCRRPLVARPVVKRRQPCKPGTARRDDFVPPRVSPPSGMHAARNVSAEEALIALSWLSVAHGFTKSLLSLAQDKKADERCEHAQQLSQPKCQYAKAVESWTDRFIVGLGLCPWAVESQNQGKIKYVTYQGRAATEVARLVLAEAARITSNKAAPFTTTMIICPHIVEWRDFTVFQDWLYWDIYDMYTRSEAQNLQASVTLVPFHPEYLKWHALPADVQVGSTVQSYLKRLDGSRSFDTVPVEIVTTDPAVAGARRVGVRYNPGERMTTLAIEDLAVDSIGPPLPDNYVHRSPYPTVHLIRREDLNDIRSSGGFEQAAKMLLHNAKLMEQLGEEGARNAAHR